MNTDSRTSPHRPAFFKKHVGDADSVTVKEGTFGGLGVARKGSAMMLNSRTANYTGLAIVGKVVSDSLNRQSVFPKLHAHVRHR